MFALVLAAALANQSHLLAGNVPQGSSAASPLREVVYKFSHDQTSEYTTEQAPGNPDGPGGMHQTATTGLAAPPESSTKTAGYRGTMTVDILQVDVDSGFIKAEVHEATNAENGTKPFDAVFIIRPDGGMVKASGSDDPDMDALMVYFATKYFADHNLAPGVTWTNIETVDKVEYDTTTTVNGVDGNNVSMSAKTKAPRGVSGGFTIDTNLVYDAAKLAPISLDVMSIRLGSGTTSSAEQAIHSHFDRISDTLDKTS